MSKSLISAFEIEKTKVNEDVLNDYDVFPDKDLLEDLRTKIIENIIDKEVPEGQTLKDFINDDLSDSGLLKSLSDKDIIDLFS